MILRFSERVAIDDEDGIAFGTYLGEDGARARPCCGLGLRVWTRSPSRERRRPVAAAMRGSVPGRR